MEVDEQEAKTRLQEGLEGAAQGKETTIYNHGDHIPDTGTSEAEQALALTAYQVARAVVVAEADETYQAAKIQHYRDYAQAVKDTNAWRASLVASAERKRQSAQRGKVLEAIMEVQSEARSPPKGWMTMCLSRTSSMTR